MTIDFLGNTRRIMNKGPGGAETFDQTTDSLEAIRDFLASMGDGLIFYGVVTAVPGANQFTIPTLAGQGAGKFAGAVNPFQAFVFRDAGGLSAAPQGELQPITAYANLTGVFTTSPFTVPVGIGDEILLVNPSIAEMDLQVPGIGSVANLLERDVIGNKSDQPNFNTDNASIIYSLMSWLRGLCRIKMVLVGNAEAGSTASSIVSVASLNQGAGYWKGQTIEMVTGANIRLSRPIVDYNAGTNTIKVSPAFPFVVGVGDEFVILNDYTNVDTFTEQAAVAVNITAILASETNVFDLSVAANRYLVRSLRLKSVDPGANNVIVRLYELVNGVSTVVDTFLIDTTIFSNYFSLMDMFGLPHLAGDNLKVTVQASAGGPYAVTGEYSYAKLP